MIKIEYPPYQPKTKKENGKEYIFDGIRKKWLLLTPEEWVRQNFLQYLIVVKKYPASLIAVEKEIAVGELKKRFDIVVYDNNINPYIIIECKEMKVDLNVNALFQAMLYNIPLQVKYLVVTNGSYCFAVENKKGELLEINSLP